MGGGVPANTTTTTTVNQSPWQNPTYQALMLGTAKNPGPLTNILRNNQGMMTAYNNLLGQGVTPADVVNSNRYNPTAGVPGTSFRGAEVAPVEAPQAAAEGGIMNVRKFATGDIINPKEDKGPAALTAGQKKNLANIQKIIDSQGKLTPKQQKSYDFLTGKDKAYQAYQTEQTQKKENTAKAQQGLLEQSMGQTAFMQAVPVIDPATGKPKLDANGKPITELQSTNPLFNQAVNRVLDAQKLPEQFGLATNAYKTGLAGLDEAAKYQAKDVTGKNVDAATMNAASMQGREANAAQMGQYLQISAQKADTERAAAAAMNRGDVRDAQALMAQVEKYDAAMMNAPADIRAQAYKAAQTQGPKSWTDPGVARQYMNPYTQNVLDQELFEANRQAQMRENQQRSQATQQKAFGGTRAALQESEGRRNLGYLLSDIENKGLQQAYQSGMGQFSAEQGLGAQVGMSNTQALNQQRSQYVTQALEAAKNNYGGQLTAAQANQVAQNAASQFNAAAQNLANNNYVAQQLQAQLANQQMDFGVGQLNTQNQQQVNLANAAAANQANQLYAQQQLAAQQANQQAGLTTEQQNAQMRQQAELANQQYGLGGFQSNLQNAQFLQQANQLNAQNQQQANLANQLYGVGGFNAQQANQQAGLQANQQNIGAYGQYLQGAGGLGALGASQAQTNLANIGALGQAASAWQNLGQQYLNTQTQNAQNAINFPSNLYSGALNAINAQPSTGGATTATGTSTPASWMGRAEGGAVEAHKAWDKAKGGKTVKKGIASGGW